MLSGLSSGAKVDTGLSSEMGLDSKPVKGHLCTVVRGWSCVTRPWSWLEPLLDCSLVWSFGLGGSLVWTQRLGLKFRVTSKVQVGSDVDSGVRVDSHVDLEIVTALILISGTGANSLLNSGAEAAL